MAGATETPVSAPGRIILFGDHAIEYGGTGVAVAVEQRVRCRARLDSRFSVNGQELSSGKHPYVRGAVLQAWTDMDRPLSIEFESGIPPGIGLGEDDAVTVACLGAISMIHNHMIFGEIASNGFAVNQDVAGTGSPLGISSAVHGRCVNLSGQAAENPLWTFGDGDEMLYATESEIPGASLVLGYTGIPAREGEVAMKIRRFHQRNSFARDMMEDLCRISAQGSDAVMAGDLERTGELMTRSHKALITMGASHPVLDSLVHAAARHSYGAKLTGSGGGGSMVALTHEPERAIRAIEEAGGKAWLLEPAARGLRLEEPE